MTSTSPVVRQFLLAVGAACALASASMGQDLAQVLTNVRGALGAEAVEQSPTGVMLKGPCTFLGAEGEFTILYDGKGRFIQQITGPLPMTTAFDGSQAWEVDFAGSGRVLELGDRESELLAGWLVTGEWPDRAGELSLEIQPSDPGDEITIAFFQEPDLRGSVAVDRTTWLPTSAHWSTGGTESELTFGEFRREDGAAVPELITLKAGDMRISLDVESIQPGPTFVRNPYERTGSGAADTSYNPDVPAALQVKRAPTGHLLVHPAVDGQDVGWFIFDTGAGINCLANDAAEKLGLEGFGGITAVGVGGRVTTPLYRASTLTIGPVTIEQPLMMGLDLKFLEQYMGEPIGGILGYNLLTRVVAEIDLADAAVALHDPARYARNGLVWEEVVLYGRHPCVHAEFEGKRGLFRLDTGAAGDTVTFHTPAVTKFNLLDGRDTVPTMMGGVGGMVAARAGVLEYFTLAGHRFDKPKVTFANDEKTAFSDANSDGNIGGIFLRPFVLVTDYSNKRIGFVEKNAKADAASGE